MLQSIGNVDKIANSYGLMLAVVLMFNVMDDRIKNILIFKKIIKNQTSELNKKFLCATHEKRKKKKNFVVVNEQNGNEIFYLKFT